MNFLRVNPLDKFEGQLLGYNIIGNKLLYLTDRQLILIRLSGKMKRQSVPIKGSQIINFVINKRGYIALLYHHRIIQIRRMDHMGQVFCRFDDIYLQPQLNYPKMKWDYDELYLLYPDSIQVLSLKDRSRKGYTDIVIDYQDQKIMDLVISNVMDSQRAVILQLKNRLIFTIIPVPITQLAIQSINQTLTIYSISQKMDSKRQYVCVLSQNRLIKVYNIVSLKQIVEVDLGAKQSDFMQFQSDVNNQCLLVRHINRQTLEITRNVIYKINSQVYYGEGYDYFHQSQPFFLYHFDISIHQNLTIFPVIEENIDSQAFHSYHLSFFKKNQLYFAQQVIPKQYSQTMKEIGCRMGDKSWKEFSQWKQIIAGYLQLTVDNFSSGQQPNFSEEQRQLQEYNIIKQDFDNIIAKFTQKITIEGQKNPLSKKNIEQQWNQYLAKIAEQRNFMQQTMKLFKIQSQIIQRKGQQSSHNINIQLEDCFQQMEGRDSRIDNQIKQRKKQLENQRKKEEENKQDQLQKIKEQETNIIKNEGGNKSKASPEQIQKYQEQYQKFVAQFLAEKQKKQKEEAEQRVRAKTNQIMQQCFNNDKVYLQMPKLNEQEKKIIHDQILDLSGNTLDLPQQNIDHSLLANQKLAWSQMQKILHSLQNHLNPLETKLQQLLSRLSTVQSQQLTTIKHNEEKIEKQSGIELQTYTKQCVGKMLEGLNSQIRKGIQSTTQKIYRLQDRNIKYYEQLIQKFKQYIKFQSQYRVEVFYRSRKRLQMSLNGTIKEQKQMGNIIS